MKFVDETGETAHIADDHNGRVAACCACHSVTNPCVITPTSSVEVAAPDRHGELDQRVDARRWLNQALRNGSLSMLAEIIAAMRTGAPQPDPRLQDQLLQGEFAARHTEAAVGASLLAALRVLQQR